MVSVGQALLSEALWAKGVCQLWAKGVCQCIVLFGDDGIPGGAESCHFAFPEAPRSTFIEKHTIKLKIGPEVFVFFLHMGYPPKFCLA